MEIGALALAGATLIAQSFVKSAASDAGKGLWSGAHQLYDLVKTRFTGQSEAQASLKQVEARPQDRDAAEALATFLEEQAKRDAGFRHELETLIEEANQHESVANVVNEFWGTVKIGKQVNIGDVHGSVSF